MYVLVDDTDRILGIGAELGYTEQGDPILINENQAFPKDMVMEIYEIEEIPEGVVKDSYSYNPETGFRKIISDHQRLRALEDAMNYLLIEQ